MNLNLASVTDWRGKPGEALCLAFVPYLEQKAGPANANTVKSYQQIGRQRPKKYTPFAVKVLFFGNRTII